MIIQNWPRMSTGARMAVVAAGTSIAALGGLAASAMVLQWGLKIPVSLPQDLLIYPEYALAGGQPAQTAKWVKLAGYAALAPAALIIAGILKSQPKPDLHGSAAFAKGADIRRAGLRAKQGLIAGFTGPLPSPNYGKPVDRFGRVDEDNGKVKVARTGHLTASNLLRYGGPEHMMLYAPTRSGKGVGVVIPNLLNWPESAVILDIKKENWTLTAGFRKAGGQEVFMFDPLEPNGRTHRWNPLSAVRRGTDYQIDDLQRLADLFIPVQSKDPFFDRAAQTAFVGVGGYLAETPELPFTLGEIYRQLTLTDQFVKTFKKRIEDRAASGTPLSQQTVSTLNDFLSKSDATFESVKSTITANLGLFANPMLDRATSASDFDFADLRRKRMSIYVGITPNNLGRLAPLLNLFFQSCVDANMQELPEHNPELKHRVLLCMDEFAAVGELPSFKRGIGYFAGYGLKVLTILQTPAQLADIYGQEGAKSYMDNAGVTVVFTPKNIDEAKKISERLGTHGMAARSESKSKYLAERKTTTISESEQKRDLMMPQELLELPDTEALVLIGGERPVRARKIRFYAEEVFLSRSRIKPPEVPVVPKREPGEDISALKAENGAMRQRLAALEETVARLTLLKGFQEANMASGKPAEVPMTDEEVADPSGISFEKMALDSTGLTEKIAKLSTTQKLATPQGTHDILAALGVPDKPQKQERA
ncbi:type IV secretory system conjugative DNA transfer family protein [Leisingera daeponensis]|uniref:Type IV secretory system conjugative DNA transfer family protein n=1 Tax=Leisingera daeponensis TaxID=405746 RepID=A0ABS7NM13_9RHOB|nr:type IV secretory system conjugative DNA transfer family protein [Leisingera daeponensis]MBY6141956.1 type IV secretory system conjugative DNA transfer family protein [Leisingera daeponensis]